MAWDSGELATERNDRVTSALLEGAALLLEPSFQLAGRHLLILSCLISIGRFEIEAEWRMRLASLPYERDEHGSAYKWEPVIVLRKR